MIKIFDKKGKPIKIEVTGKHKDNSIIIHIDERKGVQVAWNLEKRHFPEMVMALDFLIRKLRRDYFAILESGDLFQNLKGKKMSQSYIG